MVNIKEFMQDCIEFLRFPTFQLSNYPTLDPRGILNPEFFVLIAPPYKSVFSKNTPAPNPRPRAWCPVPRVQSLAARDRD